MPVLVHGHRGASAVLPENTLPAFEYAIAAGVDAIELDMAVTKDNRVVVSHDPQLLPPFGGAPKNEALIYSLSLAEVRAWNSHLPTLDEVFTLAPKGSFLFNIEAKIFPNYPEFTASPDKFVMLVLEQVRKHHLESRVIFQSFDFRALRVMKRLAPEIALAALYDGAPRDFVEIARAAGAGIVSPQFNLVIPDQVGAAHAAGLQVMAWTPNTLEDWDRLIAAGVDAIITDDPAALLVRLGRTVTR